VWLTILAAREGKNTYKGKTSAYWYIDVRVKSDHPDFGNLRGSKILNDYCGTLSFAKCGKDGTELATRAKQLMAVRAKLPYKYV